MEEAQRRALRRARPRAVAELRVEPLWGLLEERGLFTRPMIEDLQSAGSRADQARQLLIDLETRGKQAFPLFLSILRDTEQCSLADVLLEASEHPSAVAPSQLQHLKPLQLELPGEKHKKGKCQGDRYFFFGGGVMQQGVSPGEQSPPLSHGPCAPQVYELRGDPCGYCLILNNVTFRQGSGLSTRVGSDVDCQKLQKRFQALCFQVLTRRDLTAQEIVLELQELARQDHSALDCCVVVILSHGCQTSHIQFPGGIYGTDGKPIPIEKIVNYFNGSQCPSLRGKPKLFFIQACGGEERDRGFVVDCDSPPDNAPGGSLESDATPFQAPPGNVDELDAVASLPTPSDILVSYSTFPGFVSWREALSGSWYVETLDSVLEQYASAPQLLSLSSQVAHIVSAKGTFKQIPGCFNFLRKKFFFMSK
ncbi:Caspase-9 [Calypte anna]|uniref:Caspase-9 n=1 Tax=Calypte anna TaxID=9244 RepID=A0A091IGS1_CALAN|nr:Caspase-9 [Calypte anna]